MMIDQESGGEGERERDRTSLTYVSISFTQELVDKYSKLLPEQYLPEVDFDPVLDGFQRVCKDAVVALANVVFNDMEEVFVKLFNRDWYAGERRGERGERRKEINLLIGMRET